LRQYKHVFLVEGIDKFEVKCYHLFRYERLGEKEKLFGERVNEAQKQLGTLIQDLEAVRDEIVAILKRDSSSQLDKALGRVVSALKRLRLAHTDLRGIQ